MMRSAIVTAALAVSGLPAAAQDAAAASVSYPFEGSFEDAAFEVESAIVNRGLVIDFTSHVGEMLERTREDVEGSDVLFDEADIFLFCSATLSREVMEADPANIAHCPYGIYVAERDGEVSVGYRTYPEGEMQQVQSLLDEIAREATGS